MVRIRQPYEFAEGDASNQFRAQRIDPSAAAAPFEAGAAAFQTVNDIVNHAYDQTVRSQAGIDSRTLELELQRIQTKIDNDPAPDGYDPLKWASGASERFASAAEQARRRIISERGMGASNTYMGYFNERADVLMTRWHQNAIERTQARVVDMNRGTRLQELAQLRARAMDPDATDTQRAEAIAEHARVSREAAAAGTWTHEFASQQVIGLEEAHREWSDREGRLQRMTELVDQVITENPDDNVAQVDALFSGLSSARDREEAVAILNNRRSTYAAARQEQERTVRSRAETQINAHGASWQRYMSQEDLDVIRSIPGEMERIREQLDVDGGSGATVRRAIMSYQIRSIVEALGDHSNDDVARWANNFNIMAPIDEAGAQILSNYGIDVEPGDVLGSHMSREDIEEIDQRQRRFRTGEREDGSSQLSYEVERAFSEAVDSGQLSAEIGQGSAEERRRRENLMRAYIRRELIDLWRARGGTTQLTPDDRAIIVQGALRRTNRSSPPLYRNRDGVNVPFNQIPRRFIESQDPPPNLRGEPLQRWYEQQYRLEQRNRVRLREGE